jgi:hypothetical protein
VSNIPAAEKCAAIRAVAGRMTVAELAVRFNCSPATIKRVLNSPARERNPAADRAHANEPRVLAANKARDQAAKLAAECEKLQKELDALTKPPVVAPPIPKRVADAMPAGPVRPVTLNSNFQVAEHAPEYRHQPSSQEWDLFTGRRQ